MLRLIAAHGRKRPDAGFTLVEAMVAITIIGAVIAAQASILLLGAKAQTRLSVQRFASSVLQSEVETLQTTPWDDLMLAPPVTSPPQPSLCQLGTSGLRSGAQVVRPQTIIRQNDIAFIIDRTLTWTTTGQPVSCSVLPNDRAETKTLTVTVRWTVEGVEKTRKASVIISRYRVNAQEQMTP